MAIYCSTGHPHRRKPQQQHRPRISIWSPGQHGTWTPVWSPEVAWPTGINMAPGGSIDQGHLTWASEVTRIVDINMPRPQQDHGPRHCPAGSLAHGHQRGLRYHRPGTSLCPLVVTWVTDINTAPGCCRTAGIHMTLVAAAHFPALNVCCPRGSWPPPQPPPSPHAPTIICL